MVIPIAEATFEMTDFRGIVPDREAWSISRSGRRRTMTIKGRFGWPQMA
jgi:hypothetical protein